MSHPFYSQLRLEYLQGLESKIKKTLHLLNSSWLALDSVTDFRKCLKQMEKAQQSLHETIEQLIKGK